MLNISLIDMEIACFYVKLNYDFEMVALYSRLNVELMTLDCVRPEFYCIRDHKTKRKSRRFKINYWVFNYLYSVIVIGFCLSCWAC